MEYLLNTNTVKHAVQKVKVSILIEQKLVPPCLLIDTTLIRRETLIMKLLLNKKCDT